MWAFIKRYSIPILVVGALAFLYIDKSAGASDAVERAEQAEDSASMYRGLYEASRRGEEAANEARARDSVRAERAEALADSLEARSANVEIRWRTLPVDASAAQVRALADSTIAHYKSASEHWRAAFLAKSQELATADEQIGALRLQRDALLGQVNQLETANDALHEEVGRGPNALLPVAMGGLGGVVGYAVDGTRGAAIGATGGILLTVQYYGFRELLGSEIRLGFVGDFFGLLWPF